MNPIKNLNFQFITNNTSSSELVLYVEKVLKGGCKWVQLRMKDTTKAEIVKNTLTIKELCDNFDALLILDDYVDIAKETNVDGVHLGKSDMSIVEARKILGANFIIGETANSFEDIQINAKAGADYIGLGPFRFTKTKTNLSPTLGIDGYQKIIDQCRNNNINLPIFAIGGITLNDISAIMKTGVSGIALSAEILYSSNPTEKTKEIILEINKYYERK